MAQLSNTEARASCTGQKTGVDAGPPAVQSGSGGKGRWSEKQ